MFRFCALFGVVGPEEPSNPVSHFPTPIARWNKTKIQRFARHILIIFFLSWPSAALWQAKPIECSHRSGISFPNADSTMQQRTLSSRIARDVHYLFSWPSAALWRAEHCFSLKPLRPRLLLPSADARWSNIFSPRFAQDVLIHLVPGLSLPWGKLDNVVFPCASL